MFQQVEWTSNFFGVPFFSMKAQEYKADDLKAYFRGFKPPTRGIYEVRLDGLSIELGLELQAAGFALTDGRLEFETQLQSPESEPKPETGHFRNYEQSDFPQVERLVYASFAGNPSFRSRFNNRAFFSEGTSHAYYMEWINKAASTSPDLFGVWADESNKVRAFYNIVRIGEKPSQVFKVGLAAVDSNSPLRGLQNLLQSWIYWNANDAVFDVINSPALSNYAGLKNNIRAARRLAYTELIFFRFHGVTLPIQREREK